VIRRAYEEGLLDPQFMHPSEVDSAEAAPQGTLIADLQDRYPPIDDIAEATGWWARFGRRDSTVDRSASPAPAKVGRNDPCPCGSGQKFKKCCGA
jgi:uncharacterized protein YecA (UPF0149 family)